MTPILSFCTLNVRLHLYLNESSGWSQQRRNNALTEWISQAFFGACLEKVTGRTHEGHWDHVVCFKNSAQVYLIRQRLVAPSRRKSSRIPVSRKKCPMDGVPDILKKGVNSSILLGPFYRRVANPAQRVEQYGNGPAYAHSAKCECAPSLASATLERRCTGC